jgi:hypothetical protein
MRLSMTHVLAGLNIFLTGVLAWLWVDPQGGLRGVHWQAPASIKPELGAPAASIGAQDADTARFMVIVDRPVFNTSRRPAPSMAKGSGPAKSDPLDSVHLYGLFSGGAGGGAIVRVDGKTRRVMVSESIGDWSLKEVRPREAVFARGPESRVVPLVQAKQPATATANRNPMPGFPGLGAMPYPFIPPGTAAAPVAPSASVSPPAVQTSPPAVATTPAGTATAKPSTASTPAGASAGAANPFVTGASR